ncbi:hypothetical protein EAI67_22905 [Escherichia coli]|nr:hypothetical protein EAI67_22905 [Escherichia coli]
MRRNVAGALSLVALVAGERKPPHVAGMQQCCGGFIPGGIGCWREKTPARCRYAPDNTTGANLDSRPLKNSRETLSLQHRRLYDVRRAGHGLLA